MIKQRIATAAVLALLLLGATVLLPKPVVVLVLGGLFLGGFWEWAGFVGHPFGLKRAPFVAVGAAALIATYVYIFHYGGSAQVILDCLVSPVPGFLTLSNIPFSDRQSPARAG